MKARKLERSSGGRSSSSRLNVSARRKGARPDAMKARELRVDGRPSSFRMPARGRGRPFLRRAPAISSAARLAAARGIGRTSSLKPSSSWNGDELDPVRGQHFADRRIAEGGDLPLPFVRVGAAGHQGLVGMARMAHQLADPLAQVRRGRIQVLHGRARSVEGRRENSRGDASPTSCKLPARRALEARTGSPRFRRHLREDRLDGDVERRVVVGVQVRRRPRRGLLEESDLGVELAPDLRRGNPVGKLLDGSRRNARRASDEGRKPGGLAHGPPPVTTKWRPSDIGSDLAGQPDALACAAARGS